MVGWTVTNRMKQRHATRLFATWHGYSHSHPPDHASLQLATAILTGKATDISQDATHSYTPSIMPREGEPTVGRDVGGGLEVVPGVTDKYDTPAKKSRPRLGVAGCRGQGTGSS